MNGCKKNIFLLIFCIFFVKISLWSEETTSQQSISYSIEELLERYVSNDSEIKSLLIQLEKIQLSKKSADINNGVHLNLSTGNFIISSDSLKISPSVSLSVPNWNNTFIETTIPINSDLKSDTTKIDGTSFSIGTDILGGSGRQSQLTARKAERNVLEAERAIVTRALKAEEEFYNKLKTIYSQYAKTLTLQNTLYDKELNLETVKVKGFAKTSSKYRTAELEVLSAQGVVDQQKRELQRSLDSFGKDCGLDAGSLNLSDIPSVKNIVLHSGILDNPVTGSLENYIPMENSQWNLRMAQEENNINSQVNISFAGGYTYKNQLQRGADTIDTSLSLKTMGATLHGGITFPITGDNKIPSASLSLSWSPDTMRNQLIQEKQNQLHIDNSLLKITEAENKYQLAMEANKSTWEDLLWNRQVKYEEYALYEELANDNEIWHTQGLISDTEYRRSITNSDNALIQAYISDIDILLHSIKTRQMFI